MSFSKKFKITDEVVRNFAEFSLDYNPLHLDSGFAKKCGYPQKVAHGVIQLAYLSRLIGMDFPGRGAMWMKQTVDWLRPVLIGDEIEIVLTVENYSSGTKTLELLIEISNQRNNKVMKGVAQVKLTRPLPNYVNETRKAPVNTSLPSQLKQKHVQNKFTTKIIKSRVALVTGSSRGIGAAIAKQLSYDGYKVVVNYRSDKVSAEGIVKEVRSSGGEAISVCADVTQPDQVDAMVKRIMWDWGRCDAVVHGASPPLPNLNVNNTTFKNINSYLNVYLGGATSLVKNTFLSMKDNKFGRYVFLGTSAMFGTPPSGMAAYVAAKEALWGYTKSIATEMGNYGITANMVSPGITITDLTADIPVRVKEVEAMKSPIRRLASPEDTSHQVSYLCSDYSGYINGMNIAITGGPI